MESKRDFLRLKNYFRKKRQLEDQVILDQILKEMKEKHDREREEKIKEIQQQLQKIQR
jgi:hypothetical protein